MEYNRLRRNLEAGDPMFGLSIDYSDPAVVELAGVSGYDLVMFDLQHTERTLETVVKLQRAAKAWDMATLVRGWSPDYMTLVRALDCGIEGVYMTDAKGYDDVKALVDACRYPPLGRHGIGTSAAAYSSTGLTEPWNPRQRGEGLNRTQVVGTMCETVECLNDLERIATIEGLDFVFFGPSDLTDSMGFSDQPGHPDAKNAFIRGVEILNAAGMAWGSIPGHPAIPLTPDELVELGGTVNILLMDRPLLHTGMLSLLDGVKHLQKQR